MLQQILKDMYVDPDVLEALGEEQKKILFLKMREEQVRRWTERQEKEAKEDLKENRAKKGNRKSVKWLLGRDGDVHVCMIGDSDAERSPKHLLSELRQNGSIRMKQHNSEPLKNNQVDQNGVQLVLKEPEPLCGPGGAVAVPEESRRASAPRLASCTQDSRDDSDDSGTAEDDLKDELKDPSEEEENSGSASDDLSDSGVFLKSHSSRDPGLSIISRKPRPQDAQPIVKERLSVKEKPLPQETQRGDKDVSKDTPPSSLHGNRVAQLRRNFGVAGSNSLPTGAKPPVPTKPAHLQRQSTMPR